ncbi:hypothetical protein ACN47E_007354 [Coniothyrium glycines]
MTSTSPFPLTNLPGELFTLPIPETVDHAQIAKDSFTRLIKNDLSVVASNHAHWRDLLALSSTLRTFNSSTKFKSAWKDLTALRKPRSFEFEEGSSRVVRIGQVAIITAQFHFENGLEPSGRCLGFLTIAPEISGKTTANGDQAVEYKIYALSTILESIDGYGNPDIYPSHLLNGSAGTTTSNDVVNGSSQSKQRNGENGSASELLDFDALVIGLGPSGLSNIARLKALGVRAIACDTIPEVGLNWTDRYDSLKLHTPKMQNSLPFNFKPPVDAPYYLTAKDIKRFYQSFVDEYKLHDSLWLSTSVKHASYNSTTNSWVVTVKRSGQERTVTTRHLIFCLGMTGRVPRQPTIPGRDKFTGTVIHAVDFINAKSWAGKRGVVVGTANTGHDVAEDMVKAGMHVTMVQRSHTPVLNVARLPLHKAYHENVDVTDTDKHFHAEPLAIQRVTMKAMFRELVEHDREKFNQLEAKGFRVDREADLLEILYERGGRHYMDVGVSQMIIDGKIEVKSGSALAEYTAQGLKFADGSEIAADVIVFATGYAHDMKVSVARLLDAEVAEKLDESGYLDEEGNPRGSWKPIGHPNIWFCPGDISHSRFFSRFVALQVKADVEGTPLIPYDVRY